MQLPVILYIYISFSLISTSLQTFVKGIKVNQIKLTNDGYCIRIMDRRNKTWVLYSSWKLQLIVFTVCVNDINYYYYLFKNNRCLLLNIIVVQIFSNTLLFFVFTLQRFIFILFIIYEHVSMNPVAVAL